MNGEKLGRAYGKALAQMEAAEARMRRAFNAWDRARLTVKRMGKRLEEEMLHEQAVAKAVQS